MPAQPDCAASFGIFALAQAVHCPEGQAKELSPPRFGGASAEPNWALNAPVLPTLGTEAFGYGFLETVVLPLPIPITQWKGGDDGFQLRPIQEIRSETGLFCLPSLGSASGPTQRAIVSAEQGLPNGTKRPDGCAPRRPYPMQDYQRAFTPVPVIAGMRANLTPVFGPTLETRLVALDVPATGGVAPKGHLRANSEGSFGPSALYLPRPKHTVRPAQEHSSVLSALGHLTAGNRDFSLQGINRRWSRLPNDLRWLALAIPFVICVIWYSSLPSSETETAVAQQSQEQVEPGVLTKVFGDDSMLELKKSIQRRAAVELSDDFRQGLGEWSGVGDWASGWRYDRAGFLRPRQIAFYTPSLELTDYRFEFLGQIERKALSWVFRAADVKNYYVNRLEVVDPSPLPEVVLVRYAVVNGRAGPRTVTRLPMQTHLDTMYRIRVDVSGPNFVTTVQGQVVDVFSDERIPRGGVGFFAQSGEEVRLRWVEVSHQYDILGRLCAFLVPYNVSNNTMRSGQ
jgi:hypothetical protein